MKTLDRRSQESTPAAMSIEQPPAFVPQMSLTPELRATIDHVIKQWQNRERFAGLARYGIRPIDRVLFHGPPGNGKTMCCQWMCRELKLQLLRVRCEELHGQYLGSTVKAVANVMDWLNERSEPALCLFDEVEHLFIDRRSAGADSSCGNELGSATTVFLQMLDRFESPTLLVMATNLPERLDAALLSRIELQVAFGPPSQSQAVEVIEYWIERLHEFGSEEWGPPMVEAVRGGKVPVSFRAIRGDVATAARGWVASTIE